MIVVVPAYRPGHHLLDEVVVSTTCLNDNAGSHFGSLADSVRVYRPLLRFAATRLVSR